MRSGAQKSSKRMAATMAGLVVAAATAAAPPEAEAATTFTIRFECLRQEHGQLKHTLTNVKSDYTDDDDDEDDGVERQRR